VNAHIILALKYLKADDVCSLLLKEVLGEDIGTLSVRLTPLHGLSVVKLQAKDRLPEVTHHRSPQHYIDLAILPPKQAVNVRKLAQVKAASVRPALLIAC